MIPKSLKVLISADFVNASSSLGGASLADVFWGDGPEASLLIDSESLS